MNNQLIVIAGLVMLSGCARQDSAQDGTHSQEMHAEMNMVLESDTPLMGDHSLYQVESVWSDQLGAQRTLSTLEGQVQVVAMTYTSCEVSCPRIVASMRRIESDVDETVSFVLISIDPERDTSESMAAYADKMGLSSQRWSLLNGPADDVQEMAALLGVRYRKMSDGEFAHSNIVTVLDQNGAIIHQQKGLGSDLTDNTIEFLKSL